MAGFVWIYNRSGANDYDFTGKKHHKYLITNAFIETTEELIHMDNDGE